ncbi:MAG: pilus assembly protein [Chloroflexi bacterium]|nr:pilus assembly protein [Chloroflexota bacterium]
MTTATHNAAGLKRLGQFAHHAWFARDERGQFLIQFVIIFPLLMLLVGLVVDGGLMYWQFRRAEVTANAAAQAASHTIDIDYFRATNQIRLDQERAASIANEFVARNARGSMQITRIAIQPNQISVFASARVSTIFFRLVGISSLAMNVDGHAYPAFGINVEGQ